MIREQIVADRAEKRALVHFQRKDQIVNPADRFAQADLQFLESRGFFFRVDAHAAQRRNHVMNFIPVLFESVKGSDLVLL